MSRANYVLVWLTARALPAPCYFCGEEVHELRVWRDRVKPDTRDRGVIHHIDEDRENNDPDNLVIAHARCHNAYHNIGKDRTVPRVEVICVGCGCTFDARRADRTRKYCTPECYQKHKFDGDKGRQTKAKIAKTLRSRQT